MGNDTTHGNDDHRLYEEQDQFNSAELALYDAIRHDLGLLGWFKTVAQ